MPSITLTKSDGKSGGNVVLNDRIFNAKINKGLIHQAVVNEATNSRQDTRDTKTRGEVAGGGKKPYRQKGTGRARQGTISAPHYRHGGIVFGPHPRDLSSRLPKKARRVAIFSALSVKASEDAIIVLDTLPFEAISTKTAAALLKTLGITGSALIITQEHSPVVYKSFRNIQNTAVRVTPAFSVRDILEADKVIFEQGALDSLNALWGGPKSEEVEAE